jgi:hypothetical protein
VLLGAALLSYPDIPSSLIAVASPITQVKLLSFPPTVVLLLLSASVLAYRWLRDRVARR